MAKFPKIYGIEWSNWADNIVKKTDFCYNILSTYIKRQNMDINIVKKELDDLKRQIAYHSHLYYVENRNEISDYEYDMLLQ